MKRFEKSETLGLPLGEMLAFARGREAAMLRTLRELVEIESPSTDKAAVDRCAARVAEEWRRRGARVRILQSRKLGNIVRAEISPRGRQARGQILVLGHMDTVYPIGTLARMPFRIAGGRAWGPGTFDMKGGIVLALFAADALRAAGVRLRRKLVFLWTGDEEIGSHASRRAIEAEARRSDAVLVLEPPYSEKGLVKTRRKGVGSAEVLVRGRSAHAGINPEEGVNAVHELALQIERLMKMNDSRRGIAVQTTVIDGGTLANVVPEFARAEVDIRYARLADAGALERKVLNLKPILKGARIEVRGGINRPPLERTAEVAGLFYRARSIARELGFSLGEASTGGGSDGSLTAAMGVPTLDGIGAVGDGAHSPREFVFVRDLALRVGLIAGLLGGI